jgi:hypothetical protein
MIGFIDTYFIHNQYSATANPPTSQITGPHCPLPGNGFITGTITTNHYEVFLPFLVQSPWSGGPAELDPC